MLKKTNCLDLFFLPWNNRMVQACLVCVIAILSLRELLSLQVYVLCSVRHVQDLHVGVKCGCGCEKSIGRTPAELNTRLTRVAWSWKKNGKMDFLKFRRLNKSKPMWKVEMKKSELNISVLFCQLLMSFFYVEQNILEIIWNSPASI